MFKCRTVLASLGLMAALCVRAGAIEFKPSSFSDGTVYLVVSGEFGPNDSLDSFKAAATRTGAKFVTFDSRGGSIGTAMALGRLIRSLGLNTIQIRQLECVSACSLAFVGGLGRYAEPGAIGVHRSSFSPDLGLTAEEAVSQIQAGTADIMSYLTEMGIDPQLLAFALRYDKADMRYLSASEMRDLRVTNTDVDQAPQAQSDAPLPTPPPKATASGPSPESAAVNFVEQLIAVHSGSASVALAAVLSSYSDSVTYYGKTRPLSEVIADKQNYFSRWPERGYKVRPESVMATCASGMCMVSGIYDWVVRSLPRNKQAQGVARFSFTLALGPEPKVVAETSQVMK